MYVLLGSNGCAGLSMDGNIVFHYENQKIIHYMGLAVGDDCLFIGAKQ